jgi:hypothetical protein
LRGDWNRSEINRCAGNQGKKESGEQAAEEELFLSLHRATEDEKLAQSYKRVYVPYEAVLDGLFSEDDRIISRFQTLQRVGMNTIYAKTLIKFWQFLVRKVS